jgi:alpha-L-fucosidase
MNSIRPLPILKNPVRDVRNHLLNISPKADGTIPDDQKLKLLEIGEWLDQNGETIYGTRAWGRNWGEAPTPQGNPSGERGLIDGMLKTYTSKGMRFTTKGDTRYAMVIKIEGLKVTQ